MNFKKSIMEYENISVLRIYFMPWTKAKIQTCGKTCGIIIWTTFAKKAKELNIEQANIFIAKAGYLNNEKVSSNISEIRQAKIQFVWSL